MANDPHWIEHAKMKKGAFGKHSAAETAKLAKKKGKTGKRARLAQTLESLQSRGEKKLYPKKEA